LAHGPLYSVENIALRARKQTLKFHCHTTPVFVYINVRRILDRGCDVDGTRTIPECSPKSVAQLKNRFNSQASLGISHKWVNKIAEGSPQGRLVHHRTPFGGVLERVLVVHLDPLLTGANSFTSYAPALCLLR